jgi:hypothetical protein
LKFHHGSQKAVNNQTEKVAAIFAAYCKEKDPNDQS